APRDLLRHDLAQEIGLGEVLGAYHDPIALGASRQQQGDQAEGPPRPARRSPSPEEPALSAAKGRGGQWGRTHFPRHAHRRAASRTAGSTPATPSYVLRTMGKSA